MTNAANWPWVVFGIFIVVVFAVLEGYAFKHPQQENTLSRFVWTVGQKWPLSLVIFGMVFGSLATHFYWNWCPALMLPGHGG